jgi:hypothetical protein
MHYLNGPAHWVILPCLSTHAVRHLVAVGHLRRCSLAAMPRVPAPSRPTPPPLRYKDSTTSLAFFPFPLPMQTLSQRHCCPLLELAGVGPLRSLPSSSVQSNGCALAPPCPSKPSSFVSSSEPAAFCVFPVAGSVCHHRHSR